MRITHIHSRITGTQYSKSSLYAGVTILKTPRTVKSRCAKLRYYVKNRVRGTEDTRNVILKTYDD